MKLSVIVPVYNVEAYLHRCIDSILTSSFQDFELILVDDGSEDRCPSICDEYATKDARIQVIHQANKGLSEARNAGLDVATGEYIGFIDSDDYISKEMYRTLIKNIEMYDADISTIGYIQVTPNEEEVSRFPHITADTLYQRKDFLENFYPENRFIIAAPVWNKIYRRTLFEKCRFPSGKLYEDSLIQLPLYDLCKKIIISKEHGYYYTVERPQSIMNSSFSLKNFHLMELGAANYDFFQKREMDTQKEYALDAYTNHFLWCYFSVHRINNTLKKQLKPYQRAFYRHLFLIMRNTKICSMKKLIVLLVLFNIPIAFSLTRKYFPESLPPTLRILTQPR